MLRFGTEVHAAVQQCIWVTQKKNVEQKGAAASGHIEMSASHIENIALKCIQTCIHLCVWGWGGTCVCTNIYVYIDMRSQGYLTIDN